MSEKRIQYVETKHEINTSVTRARIVLERVKKMQGKGHFVKLPGVLPLTKVFIKQGRNEQKIIDKYLAHFQANRNEVKIGNNAETY